MCVESPGAPILVISRGQVEELGKRVHGAGDFEVSCVVWWPLAGPLNASAHNAVLKVGVRVEMG
jgi:hypothetical protein